MDQDFSARVIAIFDSIDAMMSDRPYRKALTEDVCREEVRKNSGRCSGSQNGRIYAYRGRSAMR
ncbi:MAG: hypothetical protein IJ300_07280 [Clostridia bacterium]|nr:hypothetical protein [Clostridia bacterium]